MADTSITEAPGDFMALPFPLEQLRVVATGRVLVLGVGGGCDVVFATAIAEYLREGAEGSGSAAAEVYVANCKGGWPSDREVLSVVEGCANFLRVPPDVKPVDPSVPTYGSTAVEQSMPRFADGSPYLVCLPSKSKDVAACTSENHAVLIPQLQRLAFDCIVGCDSGGDGLTGGVDFDGDVALGRDIQMLGVLRACGTPFVHVVIGPGCDGESTEAQMREAMAAEQVKGTFRGVFSLRSLVWRQNCVGLGPTRTPMVCLDACDAAADEAYDDAHRTVIQRNIKPAIPTRWLTHAAVLMSPT